MVVDGSRVRIPPIAMRATVVLGLTAALLVGCGSSSHRLIPVAAAGPLTGDVEAVERAAESGNGNCTATEAAILKTEQDLAALPSTLDPGLRNTLHQGIANLRTRALALCAQPLTQTVTTTTPKTTTPRTTPATTPTTTPTTTTPTTPTTTTPTTPTTTTPGSGGGTPAPETGKAAPGAGSEQGGGTGVGESGGGATPGSGSPGAQEGGK